MKRFFLSTCLLFFITVFSQNNGATPAALEKALKGYFALERENIYAHFSKNIFTANEHIWFKGYIYNRGKAEPYFSTTNVFASLIDENGKEIDRFLLYASQGRFSGDIPLNKDMPSGKYYIRFYTNWMTNFKEDESFVRDITIVNPDLNPENAFVDSGALPLTITLNPEGGNFIKGISNTFGISVQTCSGKPGNIAYANITDSSNKVLQQVPLNSRGHARFMLPPGNYEGLKATVTIQGKVYEQPFPIPQATGIAIEAVAIPSADKTSITLKTTSLTLASLGGQPLWAVLHKDGKTVLYEVDFKGKAEYKLVIANADMQEGVNTLRIIDQNLQERAVRLLYRHKGMPIKPAFTQARKHWDALVYLADLNHPGVDVSIAVLPENTIGLTESTDIYAALLLNPYIDYKNALNGRYYLANPTRIGQYELDLLLLNSKSRHDWKDILHNPPVPKHTFDMGLNIKGTINTPVSNKDNYKIKVTSPGALIDEFIELNDSNGFELDNLVLADSTMVSFALVEKGGDRKKLALYPQVLNNNRSYHLPFKPERLNCTVTDTLRRSGLSSVAFPKYAPGDIHLKEVTIEGKTKLKHSQSFNNRQLKGYRYEEGDPKGNMLLINYLRQRNFVVQEHEGHMHVYSKFGPQLQVPQILIDNITVSDIEVVRFMRLKDIEEIYLDDMAIPFNGRGRGMISIYMKRDGRDPRDPLAHITITNGFMKINPFKNIGYAATTDEGFENFGLIDWEPGIITDAKGQLKFEIPNTGQKDIKVIIEGFSADGKIISEVQTLHIN